MPQLDKTMYSAQAFSIVVGILFFLIVAWFGSILYAYILEKGQAFVLVSNYFSFFKFVIVWNLLAIGGYLLFLSIRVNNVVLPRKRAAMRKRF